MEVPSVVRDVVASTCGVPIGWLTSWPRGEPKLSPILVLSSARWLSRPSALVSHICEAADVDEHKHADADKLEACVARIRNLEKKLDDGSCRKGGGQHQRGKPNPAAEAWLATMRPRA